MRAGAAALSILAALACGAAAASVHLLSGERYQGTVEFKDGITLTTPSGATTHIDLANLRQAVLRETAEEIVPPGLVLRNGARIAGPFGSLLESPVTTSLRNIPVPGGEIAWVVYAQFPALLAREVPGGKTGALLKGGDFFEGTVRAADGRSAKVLNAIFGPRAFETDRGDLLALVLRELKPAPATWEVRTADGSIFPADAIQASPGGLTLRHPLYNGLTLPPNEITEIRAGPGRFIELTALKPARIDAPAGVTGFAIGKRLTGEALGADAAHGFESLAGVAATWQLGGEYTVFTAEVSVPADVPPIHKLIFAVYADGRPVFRSPQISSQDRAQTIRAQIGPARTLSLRVEAGFPANAAGSGLWLEPVLLRR